MSNEAKITQQELKEWFGDALPVHVAKLLYESPADMTIGQVRAAVRAEADKVCSAENLLDEARILLAEYSDTSEIGTNSEKRIDLWMSRRGVWALRRNKEANDGF